MAERAAKSSNGVTRGSTRNEAKLTDRLRFLGITPDLPVQNTMDTSAAPYCYRCEQAFSYFLTRISTSNFSCS
ncbi:uncharacterized protein VP01_953g5 [Puccinia sorghi]|uniref:Uncharacterized protein n=1 Tax=Puccinia sorghi TaxID=27349 RepID=A0A0L6U6U4_9BASI|nr:uncharacterized protein VP01_953g5 [Puccinia sorghi]